MKYSTAIIILFFSILAQVSFLRLVAFLPFTPEIALIALFILSYYFSIFRILILAAFLGVMLDLFSAVNFGSSFFAAIAAFSIMLLVREKILKRKSFVNIFLSSFMVFLSYYPLLFFANWLISLASRNKITFDLLDGKMAIEIILNVLIAFGLGYFLSIKKDYVNIRDYKKFFKISA